MRDKQTPKAPVQSREDEFIPYRKDDVKAGGKDGFVKVHVKGYGTVWASAYKTSDDKRDKRISVELLGSGRAPIFDISEFSPEEQEELRKTV